jgi:hypothetical protein
VICRLCSPTIASFDWVGFIYVFNCLFVEGITWIINDSRTCSSYSCDPKYKYTMLRRVPILSKRQLKPVPSNYRDLWVA